MSKLCENSISNVVVQCSQYWRIGCRDLCLNYLKNDISNVVRGLVCNKLPWFVSELPDKDISNVVV
jgi:hypothetical protein